jgi:hypothetical protein
MSTETEHKPNSEVGYERRDASVRTLLQFGLGLAAVIVVVFLAMRWTFHFFSVEEPLGPPPTPFENARVLPPQPRLQVEPHQDLKTFCAQQLTELNSYGWVDQQNGVVHMPIDQAMDKLLQQGLPVRAPTGASATERGTPAVAPVGTVEAPLPTGMGGPCSFLEEHPPARAEK